MVNPNWIRAIKTAKSPTVPDKANCPVEDIIVSSS